MSPVSRCPLIFTIPLLTMASRFPPLSLQPLERLHATDGLLLSADLWERAHAYHRQRQNVHYQALHQAGIVTGLGVRAVAAPATVAAQYRDRRWLRIQPGLAIDATGNPIVVDRPLEFRLASTAATEPLLVYLLIRYVDPEGLQRQNGSALVQESFRLDEQTSPPATGEIELCRLLLRPGTPELTNPQEVLRPGPQEVDLRFRPVAQARSRGAVRLATLPATAAYDQRGSQNCQELLAALPALYPALRAAEPPLCLHLPADQARLADCDLVYLTRQQYRELEPMAQQCLQDFIRGQGTVLVELPDATTKINDLKGAIQDLAVAIADIGNAPDLAEMRTELSHELMASQDCLETWMAELRQSFADLLAAAGASTADRGYIDCQHPLRRQPFLFAQWPIVRGKPVEFLAWGNVILAVGDLSLAWGVDEDLPLPRETIRTAHEIGINLLHFAWQRRELAQLLVSE